MGEYLDVKMEWSDGRQDGGRARYRASGISRDCYVLDGYAFKLGKAARREHPREAASAATMAGLVPRVYGEFGVGFLRSVELHCLVTEAVDKSVRDLLEEWKREMLTPVLAIAAIQLICRIILFMVDAAGEKGVKCHDWHINHLGMRGERLYLLKWSAARPLPTTARQAVEAANMATAYRRMKPGMKAFLKWLSFPWTGDQAWLDFLLGLQSYLEREWWPHSYGRDLPTREAVQQLASKAAFAMAVAAMDTAAECLFDLSCQ